MILTKACMFNIHESLLDGKRIILYLCIISMPAQSTRTPWYLSVYSFFAKIKPKAKLVNIFIHRHRVPCFKVTVTCGEIGGWILFSSCSCYGYIFSRRVQVNCAGECMSAKAELYSSRHKTIRLSRVSKLRWKSERYCQHNKIRSISPNGNVMFCLLYFNRWTSHELSYILWR